MKEHIVESLNAEIARLTEVRDLLTDTGPKRSRTGIRRRSPMSPATKAKISAAMAKRWAERRAKKK